MKTFTHTFTTICLLSAVLLGCGGGGGGGGNENQPPTNDKTWGTAAPIETDDGNNVSPQVAIDANGNVIVVWTQCNDAPPCNQANIWANRYVAGVGWGTAAPIETDDKYNSGPLIAMDANGNAIAVWTHCKDEQCNQRNIWANRYDVASGIWGTAAPIDTDDGLSIFPQIAMDANGNAIAVWTQQGQRTANIWANRYVAGVGWGTAAPIETNDEYNQTPQIAMDANGNAIAVWISGSPLFINVWANRYTAGVGWGTAAPIETSVRSEDLFVFRIAINAGGDAVVLWTQCNDDGSSCNIWASRYVAGGDWEKAVTIRSVPNLYALEIAMDAGGDAIVVWTQCNDAACNQDSISSLWASRYVAGTGWSETAQPIGTEAKAQFPDIAMDAGGNAIVVWTQGDVTPSNILATRYVAGTGWETAAPIETDDGNNYSPAIAMAAGGDAVVVWTQWDGTRENIWSNQFK